MLGLQLCYYGGHCRVPASLPLLRGDQLLRRWLRWLLNLRLRNRFRGATSRLSEGRLKYFTRRVTRRMSAVGRHGMHGVGRLSIHLHVPGVPPMKHDPGLWGQNSQALRRPMTISSPPVPRKTSSCPPEASSGLPSREMHPGKDRLAVHLQQRIARQPPNLFAMNLTYAPGFLPARSTGTILLWCCRALRETLQCTDAVTFSWEIPRTLPLNSVVHGPELGNAMSLGTLHRRGARQNILGSFRHSWLEPAPGGIQGREADVRRGR